MGGVFDGEPSANPTAALKKKAPAAPLSRGFSVTAGRGDQECRPDMKKTRRRTGSSLGTSETRHALIQRGASGSMPMTRYRDYTEWDSTREHRENEPARNETTNPFDDPEFRRRVGELISRAGIQPSMIEQIIGGCVTQAGEQSLNVTRNAWLNTGLDPQVGCSTVDASCGSVISRPSGVDTSIRRRSTCASTARQSWESEDRLAARMRPP